MSYFDRSNEVTVHGGQFTNVTGNNRKVAREGEGTTENTGKRAFPDSTRIRGWLHQLVEREPLPRSADSGHQDHQLGEPMLAHATSEQVQVACINCRTLEIPCITTDNPPENPCERCAKDRLTCTYVTPDEFVLRRSDSPQYSLPQYSFAPSRAPTYSFPPEYPSISPLRVSHTLYEVDHTPDQSSSSVPPPPVASSSQTTTSPQPVHRNPSAHEDIQTGSISVLNGASGQSAAGTFNESPVSTFVVYMPEKPSRADDPTAVRPEDVQFLENNVAAGGSATSIYRSIEAENWVEQNYDTVFSSPSDRLASVVRWPP
ncbi:hypothetical protein B0H13DRAFT_710809 [Mycena leptocephala]|nr:hypothetical protein B0H13DRAFT_710809 [Mycena leptocephala]